MWYAGLDHDPHQDDIEAFLGRLKTAVDERTLTLKGIPTDGSALSPDPIRPVFGDIPPQLCTFHVIKARTKGILQAVAKERKRLATSKPKRKRGRRSPKEKEACRSARKSKYIQQKISDVFQDRFVCVPRSLTRSARKRCMHITRGLPPLRQLREIMDHMYALVDRRCRTQTALGKLTKLRQWVKRFTWIGET